MFEGRIRISNNFDGKSIRMKYLLCFHRFADAVIKSDYGIREEFDELIQVIESITDYELTQILSEQRERWEVGQLKKKKPIIKSKVLPKSISVAINEILKSKLISKGWIAESPIFRDADYQSGSGSGSRWYLDFAKTDISIEVAFNHAEATAHNLIKPVLASELNHVEKEIQTKMGVIVTCTEALQKAGNFDASVGTFQSFQTYLRPYQNILVSPLVIIGLDAPETFVINQKTREIQLIQPSKCCSKLRPFDCVISPTNIRYSKSERGKAYAEERKA